MLHWQVKTSIRPRESYKQELPMTLILEALNSLQFWSLNAFLSTKICTSSMPPGLSRARQKVLSQVSLRLLNSVMRWKVEILVGIFLRGIFRNPVWKNDIFQEMMDLGELWYLIMYTMYKYYGWIIKQIIWFMKIAVPKCAKQNYPHMTRTKDDCNRFLQVHSCCVCCNISNQTRLLHISSQGWWQNLSLSVYKIPSI